MEIRITLFERGTFQLHRRGQGLIYIQNMNPQSNEYHEGLRNNDVLLEVSGRSIANIPEAQDALTLLPFNLLLRRDEHINT